MKLIKNIISISGLISAIIVFTNGGLQLALLPLFYAFLIITFMPNKTIVGPGIVIMLLVLSLRYIVYPISLISAIDFNILCTQKLYNEALALMLIEMLIIIVFVNYFCNRKSYSVNIISISNKQINWYIPVILLIAFIFIRYSSNYATNQHFILDFEDINKDLNKVNGVSTQIVSWFNFYIVIFIFNFFYLKYKRTSLNIYFYLSIFVMLYPCMFYSGHSRLSLLMPIVATVFVLRKVYGRKSNLPVIFIGIFGLVILLFLSLSKTLSTTETSQLGEVLSSSSLNAYFGGIGNVITGIRTYQNYGSSIFVFVSDCLRNAMGISEYFANFPSSSSMFNEMVYGGGLHPNDQIIPTITQGFIYFGKFLFFLPTLFMTWMVCIFDRAWAQTNDIQRTYLYVYFITIVGWAIPGAFTHFTSNFFNRFVPLLIMIIINNGEVRLYRR